MNALTKLPISAPTLGFLLHDVARLLRRRFEQHAKDCGLTRSQWQVLASLAQNEGINQTGLAELLDIEPITVGRLVDKLQAMGLIERRPDRSDRRVWLLYSTPAAAAQLVHLRALGDLTRSEALVDVSDAERAQLVALLQTLKANLTAACERPASSPSQDRADAGGHETQREADLERA